MEKQLPKNWVECGLFDISNVITGKKDANHSTEDGQYTFFTCALESLKSPDYSFDDEVLILPGNGANVGHVFYFNGKFQAYQRTYIIEKIKINPKYLYYHLLTFWRTRNENEQFGTATNYIKIGNFQSYKVHLAPIEEQNRIVDKLDILFAQLEIIKSKILRLYELKESFFESIFYKNKGFSSLELNLIERKEKVGTGWINFKKIGVSAKEGIIDLRNLGSKQTFENYKIVKTGDIIYNTMRVNIGSIAIYEGFENAITSPDYVVFSTKNISKYLLVNYLKSNSGKMNISSLTTGSVRSRLYFKNLILIPFPSLSKEQHVKSEQILKWFDVNLRKLDIINTTNISDLEKSILNKTFKGQLTQQLKSDGDAADLLKEITNFKRKTSLKNKKI